MMQGDFGHGYHHLQPVYMDPAMWYNAGTGRVVRSMLESDMSMTKARFLAQADQQGVEVEEEQWSETRHFHAYAPDGKHFSATETRNIGLGDYRKGERPDWGALVQEIRLEPCCADCEH